MNDPDIKALFTPDGGSRHISMRELPSDKEAECSGYYVVPIHSNTSEREKGGIVVFMQVQRSCQLKDLKPGTDGINLIE